MEQVRNILSLALVIFLVAAEIGMAINTTNQTEAINRVSIKTGVSPDKIIVVRRSNNSWIFGHPSRLTLELMVDGKPFNEDCWSSSFSPMVCTITPVTFTP